jgi:excinuclease ABC subunit C
MVLGQYTGVNIESFGKLNIPDVPGVYFWKQGPTILYIGKATSLRDRVRSYLSADLISTRGPRMVDMVFKSDSIEWRETDSVLEALIAEANLIKKHWPDYNVRDKDDRSFNYVVITREEFPRLIVLRGRNIDVEKKKKELKIKKIFGPFPNGAALREALKITRKMFPYLDEKFGTKGGKDKYHFYRQIGLAPDTSTAEAKIEYQKTIKHITLFFGGKKTALIRELEKEMSAYAREKQFEKAGEIKYKIFALTHIQDIALVKEDVETFNKSDGTVTAPGFRIEAYDIAHMSGKESVGVMTVVCDGEITKSEYRKFKLSPGIGNNDTASLREIIERRLNHPEWRMPDLMVIDGGQGQLNLAEKVLQERGAIVPIVSVVKDERHKPADVLGSPELVARHKKGILLANSESHRFAIAYHRKLRRMRNPRRGKL